MKFKKLSKLVVVSGLVIAFGTSSIFAVDGGVKDSNVGVRFVKSDVPTPPVDPENPDEIIDPFPEGGGTNGPLSIDFVSDLDFGEQKVSSQDETYYALPQKTWAAGQDKVNEEPAGPEKPNFVQVTDSRGLETGWELTVQQNGQLKTSDDKVLTGAELIFRNANIVTNAESGKPILGGEADTSSSIAGATKLTINTDGSKVSVMKAEDGKGAGTFLTVFGNTSTKDSSIELFVPKGTTKYAGKDYKTTLTWTLTDTPQI